MTESIKNDIINLNNFLVPLNDIKYYKRPLFSRSENQVINKEKAQTVKDKKRFGKNSPTNVEVRKSLTPKPAPTLEINVIGKTVHEALPDVEAFLDSAIIANLEEVRIVHGMGTGKLRAGIHEFLRTNKNVDSFRLGKYGEGDTGVTIVKIK